MEKKIVTGRLRKRLKDKQTIQVPVRLTPGLARSLQAYCRRKKVRYKTQGILEILQEKFSSGAPAA